MSQFVFIIDRAAECTTTAPEVRLQPPVRTFSVGVAACTTATPPVALQPPVQTAVVAVAACTTRVGAVVLRPPVQTITVDVAACTTTTPSIKHVRKAYQRPARTHSTTPAVKTYFDRRPSRLLPQNRTAFEASVLQAASDALPSMVRESVDPDRAPRNILPWLAAHESVDLWYEDWTDDRKRTMIKNALALAWKKGTYSGSVSYLDYVDGEMLDAVRFPSRFIMGRARIGPTPIGHPAFVARYLVKVETRKPTKAFVLSRSRMRRQALITPSREPFKRCMRAVRIAKAAETEIRMDFAHKRQLYLSDGVPLDGTHYLGEYVPRNHLFN